jgi:hypothetical protein
MNDQELQSLGWVLAEAGRVELLRVVGTEIWQRWLHEIMAEGKHPRRAELLAFLRGWAAPAGDWLPDNMAEYLADRLDRAVSTPEPGGRPRLSYEEEAQRMTRDLDIAADVLDSWQAHREARTPYPQNAAIASVAERWGLSEAEVKLAFNRQRKRAQILAKLEATGASMESLPDAEIDVLADDGPDDPWSLVIWALPKDEIDRIAGGESIFSVLGLRPEEPRFPSSEQD